MTLAIEGLAHPGDAAPAPVPDVQILVDTREPRTIVEILQAKGQNVVMMELQEEDYIVGEVHIHRKRVDDLIRSLNSNHLTDELVRLLPVAHEVALVVEDGPVTSWKDIGRVKAVVRELNVKLPVERTKSLEDTADYLIWVAHKVRDGSYRVIQRRPVLIGDVDPVVTAYLWLPRVGPKLAAAIAKKYPKPIDFVFAVWETFQFIKAGKGVGSRRRVLEQHPSKTKKAWREARWDAGIDGIGEDTAEQVEAAVLDGSFPP